MNGNLLESKRTRNISKSEKRFWRNYRKSKQLGMPDTLMWVVAFAVGTILFAIAAHFLLPIIRAFTQQQWRSNPIY